MDREIQRLVREVQPLPPLERCREIRQDARVSLRRLGAVVGVSGQTVLNWENGSRRPAREHRTRYRQVLAALERATADRSRAAA